MNFSADRARIVFMGSPEFSIPSLQALIENFNVVGVVTQPDRSAGRGQKMQSPPVKSLAEENNIEILQPPRLKEPSAFQRLTQWQSDLIVVAAFGQILRKNVLDLPNFGSINVHASLLPRWRGAAPIQAAILEGDSHTGATIMRMDEGLDTGPILSQQRVEISSTETAGTLNSRLAILGAELLIDTIPSYLSGEIKAKKQDDTLSTYAGMLKKQDGELDLSQKASLLARQVRAYNPWPGTFAIIKGQRIKIIEASISSDKSGETGLLADKDGLPAISVSEGWLLLNKIQAPGKKSMSGKDFLLGARNWEGFTKQESIKEKS